MHFGATIDTAYATITVAWFGFGRDKNEWGQTCDVIGMKLTGVRIQLMD